VIEVAAKAAKVDGVGVHTLRHSAATKWLESGTRITQVARNYSGTLHGHHG
jgi:integrase